MKKEKITVGLILCIWLLMIIPILGQRLKIEKQDKTYETLINYEDFKSMAFAKDQSIKETFAGLAKGGADTVTVGEETINSMKVNPDSTLETSMNGMNLRVKGSPEDLAFIQEGLKTLKEPREIRQIGETEIEIQGRAKDLVLTKQDSSDVSKYKLSDRGEKASLLEYVGLGYNEKLIHSLKEIPDLNINLTPSFLAGVQDDEKTFQRFVENVEKNSRGQHFVLFPGNQIYGAGLEEPEEVQNRLADFLKKNNLALVLLEDITQRGNMPLKGGEDFIKRQDVQKARCLITWDFLQKHYDYEIPFHHHGEELTNVYYRAITERNISLVMLKPFLKNNAAIYDQDAYRQVMGPLHNRLDKMGYQRGQIEGMGNYQVNRLYKILPSLVTVLGGVYLLSGLFNLNKKSQLGLFILGSLLAFGIFGLGKGENYGDLIFNLANIITFPSLALLYLAETQDKLSLKGDSPSLGTIFSQGAKTLFIALAISMIGALNEVVFLCSSNYMLEISIFRGVKISQIFPLLLMAYIYLRKIYMEKGQKMNLDFWKEIMDFNVKIWQVCLGILALIVLGIFILRGGNTSGKIPSIELLLRNSFENFFYARPRTKAIFIGFPAVILLVYGAYKNMGKVYRLVFFFFAAIGMVDVTNTFSHIRTPLVMSFARVGIEYVGALFVGLILLVIFNGIHKHFIRQ